MRVQTNLCCKVRPYLQKQLLKEWGGAGRSRQRIGTWASEVRLAALCRQVTGTEGLLVAPPSTCLGWA